MPSALSVLQPRGREEPSVGERQIQHRRGVALGEHQPVALVPTRIGRIDPHDPVVERHHDFHQAQRPAEVAGAGAADHVGDDVAPLGRQPVELVAIKRGLRYVPVVHSVSCSAGHASERPSFVRLKHDLLEVHASRSYIATRSASVIVRGLLRMSG